jgi:hypothetical protein
MNTMAPLCLRKYCGKCFAPLSNQECWVRLEMKAFAGSKAPLLGGKAQRRTAWHASCGTRMSMRVDVEDDSNSSGYMIITVSFSLIYLCALLVSLLKHFTLNTGELWSSVVRSRMVPCLTDKTFGQNIRKMTFTV